MAKDETTVEVAGRSIRITSPGKVMFPDRGWTKWDVIEHFVRCGPGAVRGVDDRPCLLKRWPRGAGQAPFFQKRASKNPPMATADIRFPSQRPGRMHVPRDLGDVLTMVQLNCLDLNPWPVRASDTDHPDELRIDLDPTEGVGFEAVRSVAATVKGVLDDAGLTGWPKTSGSRGIHIYARIETRWAFHEARRAVLALAREVERRDDRATTRWWKEERSGVFVDYNQMARDKTIASAYSVRPTGLVSAPFRWSELNDVDPHAMSLGAFPARWEEAGDPSAGIDDAVGSLATLLDWVRVDEEERGEGDAPWPPHYPKQPGEPPRVQPSKMRPENWE